MKSVLRIILAIVNMLMIIVVMSLCVNFYRLIIESAGGKIELNITMVISMVLICIINVKCMHTIIEIYSYKDKSSQFEAMIFPQLVMVVATVIAYLGFLFASSNYDYYYIKIIENQDAMFISIVIGAISQLLFYTFINKGAKKKAVIV